MVWKEIFSRALRGRLIYSSWSLDLLFVEEAEVLYTCRARALSCIQSGITLEPFDPALEALSADLATVVPPELPSAACDALILSHAQSTSHLPALFLYSILVHPMLGP